MSKTRVFLNFIWAGYAPWLGHFARPQWGLQAQDIQRCRKVICNDSNKITVVLAMHEEFWAKVGFFQN